MFSRRRYVSADPLTPEGLKEILWLTPDGREMTEGDWDQEFARCLGVYLAGGAIAASAAAAGPIKDCDFLLLLNAHHEAIPFRIPQALAAKTWVSVLDTAQDDAPFHSRRLTPGKRYPLQGRSLVLLEEAAAT